MTALQLGAALTGSALLIAAALYYQWTALRYERPDWRTAPWLSTVAWWLGQAINWVVALTLAAGLASLAVRAVWGLLREGG